MKTYIVTASDEATSARRYRVSASNGEEARARVKEAANLSPWAIVTAYEVTIATGEGISRREVEASDPEVARLAVLLAGKCPRNAIVSVCGV